MVGKQSFKRSDHPAARLVGQNRVLTGGLVDLPPIYQYGINGVGAEDPETIYDDTLIVDASYGVLSLTIGGPDNARKRIDDDDLINGDHYRPTIHAPDRSLDSEAVTVRSGNYWRGAREMTLRDNMEDARDHPDSGVSYAPDSLPGFWSGAEVDNCGVLVIAAKFIPTGGAAYNAYLGGGNPGVCSDWAPGFPNSTMSPPILHISTPDWKLVPVPGEGWQFRCVGDGYYSEADHSSYIGVPYLTGSPLPSDPVATIAGTAGDRMTVSVSNDEEQWFSAMSIGGNMCVGGISPDYYQHNSPAILPPESLPPAYSDGDWGGWANVVTSLIGGGAEAHADKDIGGMWSIALPSHLSARFEPITVNIDITTSNWQHSRGEFFNPYGYYSVGVKYLESANAGGGADQLVGGSVSAGYPSERRISKNRSSMRRSG